MAVDSIRSERPRPTLLAPWWHTALLATLFIGLAAGGAAFQRGATSDPAALRGHPHVAPLYLSMILMEWGLVLYVWRGGLSRSGVPLRDLVGARGSSARSWLVDAALAAALWGIWALVSRGWERVFGPDHAASIGSLLPQGPLEVSLWVALSLSAGFCEELVFRGYLQRQFTVLTRSAAVAWLLQSAFFGISHGYQGAAACAKIAVYGALFGALAMWRRSLRPGMLAHAATDILAGLFRV